VPAARTSAYYRATERLAAQVETRRRKHGWTQEDLAEKVGISRNQVQNIEKNRNNTRGPDGRPGPANPNLDTVFALAHALNCSVAELIDSRD
jgi:transcriptional regulator with XRE-family HTH domain